MFDHDDVVELASPSSDERLVCVSHSAGLGGAERDLLELMVDLAHEGTRVLLVAPKPGELSEAASAAGIKSLFADLPWAWGSEAWVTSLRRDDIRALVARVVEAFFGELAAGVQEFMPTAVLSQSCVNPWGILLAQAFGVRHIWNIREFGDLDHGLVPFLSGAATPRDIAASSYLVYACSREVSDCWEQRLARPVKPLYSHALFDRDNLRQRCSVEDLTHIAIAHLGSLENSKSPEILVEAVRILADQGVYCTAVFLGDGSRREEIEELIISLGLSDRVSVRGHVANPVSALAECNVIVSCARREAMGRGLREGALLGLVPVFPSTASWGECFIHGETGLAYAAGSSEALAESLRELSSGDAIERLSRATYQAAICNFGHPLPAQQLLRDLAAAPKLETFEFVGPIEEVLFECLPTLIGEFDQRVQRRNEANAHLHDENARLHDELVRSNEISRTNGIEASNYANSLESERVIREQRIRLLEADLVLLKDAHAETMRSGWRGFVGRIQRRWQKIKNIRSA